MALAELAPCPECQGKGTLYADTDGRVPVLLLRCENGHQWEPLGAQEQRDQLIMALFDTAAEGLSPVLYALTRAQDRGSGVARKLLDDLVTVQNYLRDMVAFLGESA